MSDERQLADDSSTNQPHDGSENETRQSLLQHFSSETIAHTTNLLSFALIALGILSLPSTQWFAQPLQALVLPILIAAFTYVLGRTVYWGYLAHAILRVPMAKGLSTIERMRKNPEDREVKEGYVDLASLPVILFHASDTWVQWSHPFVSEFSNFSTGRLGPWLLLAGVISGVGFAVFSWTHCVFAAGVGLATAVLMVGSHLVLFLLHRRQHD